MIAITGANGQLGQLVIKSLLEKVKADNIVALVRNPDKAESLRVLGIDIRQADYNEPATLNKALQGIDKVLLISSNDVGNRAPQHEAVIQAAKEAGVNLLAYTSILKAETSPLVLAKEHQITERMIQESDLPAVILRNGWYTENYTDSIAGVLDAGAVAGAAAKGKLHTATRKDYAEAAAVVLTSDNQAGQVYELAGDEGFTLEEYAAEIAKQTGKDIVYSNMSEVQFAQLLSQIGLPEGFAQALADSEAHAANGWLADDSKTLSKLIGRDTTSLSGSIAQAI